MVVQLEMPNCHNIDINDELWPKRGEKLRYIWNTVDGSYKSYYETPTLNCGTYYEVKDVKYIPCKDQILISDDTLMWFWVDLSKFNFLEESE